jgi:hypothetical protein
LTFGARELHSISCIAPLADFGRLFKPAGTFRKSFKERVGPTRRRVFGRCLWPQVRQIRLNAAAPGAHLNRCHPRSVSFDSACLNASSALGNWSSARHCVLSLEHVGKIGGRALRRLFDLGESILRTVDCIPSPVQVSLCQLDLSVQGDFALNKNLLLVLGDRDLRNLSGELGAQDVRRDGFDLGLCDRELVFEILGRRGSSISWFARLIIRSCCSFSVRRIFAANTDRLAESGTCTSWPDRGPSSAWTTLGRPVMRARASIKTTTTPALATWRGIHSEYQFRR